MPQTTTRPDQSNLKRIWKSKRLYWVTTPILLIIFFAIWELYIKASGISSLMLPSPRAIGTALWEQFRTPYIWTDHFTSTLYAILIGFGIGLFFGAILGYVVGKSPVLERMLRPFIVVTQVIPKVSLIPLFILWLGFGSGSKILIAALLAFFPFFINTAFGVRSVPSSMRDLMKTLGANRVETALKVDFPATLPYVMTAAELAIVQATIGAIVTEYMGGEHGLGRYAVTMQANLRVEELFGAIVLMAGLGLLLYTLVGVIRRVVIPWHESVRSD